MLQKMQTTWFRIWTQIAIFTSCNDNCYTMNASYLFEEWNNKELLIQLFLRVSWSHQISMVCHNQYRPLCLCIFCPVFPCKTLRNKSIVNIYLHILLPTSILLILYCYLLDMASIFLLFFLSLFLSFFPFLSIIVNYLLCYLLSTYFCY